VGKLAISVLGGQKQRGQRSAPVTNHSFSVSVN
jgi:hypothetical protein